MSVSPSSWMSAGLIPRSGFHLRVFVSGRASVLGGAAQPRSEHGLFASMSVGGTGECLAIEGSTTRAMFEAYLEQVFLLPSLEPGQVMVVDNLSAHPGTFGAHHGSDNPRHLQSYDPRHGTQAAEVMEDVLA